VLIMTTYRDAAQQSLLLRFCALILAGAVIVSHPFLPLIATALVVGMALWIWREKPERVDVWWLAGAMLVAVIAWMLYVATIYFFNGISFLRVVLLGTRDVVESWTPLPVGEVLRRASPAALALIAARLAAYAGIGLAALSGLLLRTKRTHVLILLGLTVASGTAVLTGFASEAPWLQRLLYFALPLLTLAAGVALDGWINHLRIGERVRLVGGLAMGGLLLLGLVLWHPPSLLYSLHPGQAGFVVWPQETAAARYVSQVAGDGEVGSDLQTMIVYTYFRPDYAPFAHGISMGSDLDRRLRTQPLLFDGAWLVQSGRQEIVSYQAQDLGRSFWTDAERRLAGAAERLYDNGFIKVYRRR
jgi:hypothetical protein